MMFRSAAATAARRTTAPSLALLRQRGVATTTGGRRLLGAPASAVTSNNLDTTKRWQSNRPWENFEMGPLDPIIGLNEEYNADDYPQKVIVGVGAYRTDEGKPYVLPVVKRAEEILLEQNLDMEYSGIAGDPTFCRLSMEFVYGKDCPALVEKRIQGVQALSGTGGLRVMGELLRKHGHGHIYVPAPTWGNHRGIFTNAGLEVRPYRYFDAASSDLDFDGMIADIRQMPAGSCILLHACAHNPTGMDPTLDQWKQLSQVCKEQELLPFFDCAYQGFASGNAEQDAAAVRMFVQDGHEMAVVQSYSKNFGLYGHRIGALSIVAGSPEEASRVISQLKLVIRPMYSNPPRHGARIITTVLQDDALTAQFQEECKGMADRIQSMRTALRVQLESNCPSRPWDHITKQIGMFAYSGLDKDQVMYMRTKHHLYCTLDGRISMAGVTTSNVDYIANAVADAVKSSPSA